MPQDLLKYILKGETIDIRLPSEQDPTDVPFEIISLGSLEMKVYFPHICRGKTIVFLHFPGG